jgi:hypothetical protein
VTSSIVSSNQLWGTTNVDKVQLVAATKQLDGRSTTNVRFGSLADMCVATAHVCYGPKADIDGPRDPLTERLVFDRNYVALQALLSSCIQFFGWFADDYRASGKIFWLPC